MYAGRGGGESSDIGFSYKRESIELGKTRAVAVEAEVEMGKATEME